MVDISALKVTIHENLRNIALKDGKITDEEELLIANVISNLDQYTKLIENALKDGIITKDERETLFDGRMKMMEESYRSARSDYNISDDESAILQRICKLVLDLERS